LEMYKPGSLGALKSRKIFLNFSGLHVPYRNIGGDYKIESNVNYPVGRYHHSADEPILCFLAVLPSPLQKLFGQAAGALITHLHLCR
jgi:hypothetical protein